MTTNTGVLRPLKQHILSKNTRTKRVMHPSKTGLKTKSYRKKFFFKNKYSIALRVTIKCIVLLHIRFSKQNLVKLKIRSTNSQKHFAPLVLYRQ